MVVMTVSQLLCLKNQIRIDFPSDESLWQLKFSIVLLVSGLSNLHRR